MMITPPEAFGQSTIKNSMSMSVVNVRLFLGLYSGRPNPALLLTDQNETNWIVENLRDTTQSRASWVGSRPIPGRRAWQGLLIHLEDENGELLESFMVANGAIRNSQTRTCFADERRLERYLVEKFLGSTKERIDPSIVDRVREAAGISD